MRNRLVAVGGVLVWLSLTACGRETKAATRFLSGSKGLDQPAPVVGVSPPPYRIIDLGLEGSPRAMNAADQLTGSLDASRAFITDAGGTNLRPVDGVTRAVAINNRGDLAGSRESQAGTHPAVRYSDGTSKELIWTEPKCEGASSPCIGEAWDINDWGQVVGSYANTFHYPDGFSEPGSKGFLYSGGQFIDLGSLGGPHTVATAINNKGHIAGYSDTFVDSHSPGQPTGGFLYKDGRMEALSIDAFRARPYAINDSDAIVGEIVPFRAHGQAFLWEDGKLTRLGAVGGSWIDIGSTAIAINNHRQVIGTSGRGSFLWQDGVMMKLNDIVDSPVFDILPRDINDRGHIAALGSASDGVHALLLVPEEPSSAVAVARFDGTTGKASAPSRQNFDGTLSHSTAPGAWIVSCEWDFGDDSPKSNECWTQHTYTSNDLDAAYTAVLRVKDSTGAVGRAFLPVNLIQPVDARIATTASKPLEESNGILRGAAPLTFYFDATTSTARNPNAWVQYFEWDFGDGTKSFGHAWVEHVYKNPGHYTVSLSAVDSSGKTGNAFQSVTVDPPSPPKTAQAVARFDGSTGIGSVPSTQSFDGTLSRSLAPGGWIASCRWAFGDSDSSEDCWTRHTFAASGNYDVTLTVVDSTGSSDTAHLKVQVGNALHARARLDGSGAQGVGPFTAYFDATTSSTDEPGGWIQSFEWDFGDGSARSNAAWTSHVYTVPGQYAATLKATDSKGHTAFDFIYITVE